DRVAVGEHERAVLQHGNLPERIELEEVRRAPHLGRRGDEAVREAQHAQQQHHPVGVTGEFGAVQDDGRVAHGWFCDARDAASAVWYHDEELSAITSKGRRQWKSLVVTYFYPCLPSD